MKLKAFIKLNFRILQKNCLMKKIKLIYLSSLLFLSIVAFCAIKNTCSFSNLNQNTSDSLYEKIFQNNIDKYEVLINEYNQLVFDSTQFQNSRQSKLDLRNQLDSERKADVLQFEKLISADSVKKQLQAVVDSASKIKLDFSNINTEVVNQYLQRNADSIVFSSIKLKAKSKFDKKDSLKIISVFSNIKSQYTKLKSIEINLNNLNHEDSISSIKYLNSLRVKDSLFKIYNNEVSPSFDELLSYDSTVVTQYFSANGKKYFKFILTNNDSFDVQISTSNATENGRTIKSLWDKLYKEKKHPFFLMNAGMYNRNYEAQGLLVQDGKQISPVDINNKSTDGNFYLYPNGIFYIDTTNSNTNFGLMETQEFIKNKPQAIKFASQSGPMLVHNNKIHTAFSPKSKNTNIRNGIGILKNSKGVQKIVFLVSETPVTFHEIATVFKDFLHCREALYFDGTVSRYYFNNNKKVFGELDNSQRLGPIIGVFKKKPNNPVQKKS